MRKGLLLKRNLAYFWRTNLAVVCGVAAAVAVLTGALLVGDSVRASLRDLLLLRLGRTSHFVSASTFFRYNLAADIQAHEEFAAHGFDAACPLIAVEGAVTHERSARRGAGVQVYGVDEHFWRFHGRDVSAPQNREVLLSESLARELETKAGDTILLRVEKPSAIPVESLHGRKEETGRTVRLFVRGSLEASAMGEFSVRPQQSGVRALFVPLKLLQKELEQEGKVNALLISEREGDGRESEAEARTASLRKILKERVTLEDLGIRLRFWEERGQIAVESESGLVNDRLAETARATAAASALRPIPVLSYLANKIRAGPREIPYSIVTAIDEESFERLKRAGTQAVAVSTNQQPPILLNEWAARELGVKVGDAVSLDYYLWQEGGRLLTKSAQFELAGVVGIEGAASDRDLVPQYPGITGTESLSDWNPPFPVDLSLIGARDEEYWDKYRTTPKAFIPLAKGQELWQSRFGKLTSIRLEPAAAATLELHRALDDYRARLKQAIEPEQMNLVVYPARAEGLRAARGATDFGEYFLYFSFFLVASALLLAALFFKLGVEQRLREIGILQATGFAARKVRSLFLLEGLLLAGLGTIGGLAGALLYGAVIMRGLRTWWIGAVGTTMLGLHVSPTSLVLGSIGGLLASALCIVWTLRRLSRLSTRSLLAGTLQGGEQQPGMDVMIKTGQGSVRGLSLFPSLFRASRLGLLFAVLACLMLLAAAVGWIGQAAGFFCGGTALMVALLCYQAVWLRRRSRRLIGGHGWLAVSRLGVRNATHRPGRSVLCIALVASAAFIIVSVDAFKRDGSDALGDRKSGSGGYALLAESLLPLVHDPNTPEGKEALNLWTNEESSILDRLVFTRFRLRPGDDASCLNLYQPRSPRVVAPVDDFLPSGRFSFQSSLAQTEEEKKSPWLLLNKELPGGEVPVIADANSLAYVLHLKVGDPFVLDAGGAPVRARVVGALSDSIFQSELLMSERNFMRLFPEQEGHRFFLLDAKPEEADRVAGLLEERLSDYGLDVVGTEERLAEFHRVENTFISTFQMLGGLGLVLGTLGLGAVLLRNVLERRRELALLRAVGYNGQHFSLMVIAENAFLLISGLITGTLCALISIAPAAVARGGQAPTYTLALLLIGVLASGLLSSLVATIVALRSPLLLALRAE
ncbi:MAG TPA: ABC transporter permease [Pyrinomonadaceae bacterium]|jgi:ABC-type lipoprotein release transport system permease subunit